VRAYRELWDQREARWPLVSSTVARLTPGMLVLALVLALRGAGYTFTAAGVVAGAHQLGLGAGAPVQGRLVDRFGQRAVLVPDALLFLLGTAVLASLIVGRASVPVLVGVAALTGAVYPPTTPCARVLLSTLFPSGQLRETAFAVTGVAVELGFVLGPLAAVVIAETIGATWAVVVGGLFAALGGGGYAATRAAASVARRTSARLPGGALRSPGIRVMVLAFGGIALVFGVLDLVLPAFGERYGVPFAAGLLIAAMASGSALGAVVYGSRPWPGTVLDRLRLLGGVFVAGLLVLPLATGSLPVFAAALFLSGICLGPATICAFQLIDDLALPGTQTEAQSWTQASVVVGVAAGAALSGAIIDQGRPAIALVLGAVSVVAALLLIHDRREQLRQVVRGSEAVPAATGSLAS
jgi:MFS family permease